MYKWLKLQNVIAKMANTDIVHLMIRLMIHSAFKNDTVYLINVFTMCLTMNFFFVVSIGIGYLSVRYYVDSMRDNIPVYLPEQADTHAPPVEQ